MARVIDQNWILHKTSNISCFCHLVTKRTFFGANCTPKRYFAQMVLQIMFLSSNEQIVHQNGFSHECYYKSFISIITSTERRIAIVIDQNWILHKTSNISCFWHVVTKKHFLVQIVHQNGISHKWSYKSCFCQVTSKLYTKTVFRTNVTTNHLLA